MMAPLILFVYNRPEETRRTVEALLRNPLAKQTHLYIFSDAAKDSEHEESVERVRRYISDIHGFERIEIRFADQNKGLSRLIIEGVNEIILCYEKVIVLEDNLIVASDFLDYMNQCLNLYNDRKDIWSIAGYTPPIVFPAYFPNDVFLFGRASSHGWATWLDRWKTVDWQIKDFQQVKRNKTLRQEFNRTGNDMYRILDLHMMGRVNSWIIRFCYAQFKVGAFTIYPVKPKVQINGYRAGLIHSGQVDYHPQMNIYEGQLFPEKGVQFDQELANRFRMHQDHCSIGKIGYFLCKYNMGYHQIKSCVKDLFKYYRNITLWENSLMI